MSKLVLNQIAKKELTQRQLGSLKGGNTCTCGCCYVDHGGSAWNANGQANCLIPTTTNCPGGFGVSC